MLNFFTKVFLHGIAYAHCDIPCGIYDPNGAQLAAHTVLRMTQLLAEKTDTHDIARITHTKEKHGEAVEEELGTLENDYFKTEHFEQFPELNSLLSDAVKLSIETRQHVDKQKAEDLLEKVLQISEIFYKTKNVTPLRVPSVYPTKGEIVIYTA
ncbi:MAG: superoxide dismutase, Ni [Candidatus Levybacteria bacterium]|nr:superoxide dismutase, Ni [Candidatus Levybacteria bacterium]MBP9814745.1 superoxide dismutase, Ni [Candidatus Levybacteria bacterium]